MYIKVSKTMVKTLNKALKTRIKNNIYTSIKSIEYDTASVKWYENNVNYDLFTSAEYGDYNASDNTFRFITVIYNDDCYSVNRYFTTQDLCDCFNNSDETLKGFIEHVFDMIEI